MCACMDISAVVETRMAMRVRVVQRPRVHAGQLVRRGVQLVVVYIGLGGTCAALSLCARLGVRLLVRRL